MTVDENCLAKLRAHFLDEQDGVEPVVEVKLMVLGNGWVGKTQFCLGAWPSYRITFLTLITRFTRRSCPRLAEDQKPVEVVSLRPCRVRRATSRVYREELALLMRAVCRRCHRLARIPQARDD